MCVCHVETIKLTYLLTYSYYATSMGTPVVVDQQASSLPAVVSLPSRFEFGMTNMSVNFSHTFSRRIIITLISRPIPLTLITILYNIARSSLLDKTASDFVYVYLQFLLYRTLLAVSGGKSSLYWNSTLRK